MQDFDIGNFAKTLCQDKRTLEMFRFLINNAYIRVVNYHNTNLRDIQQFEDEIAYYSKHFSSVSIADIDEFFETQQWTKEKPGLIPAVFEGFRSHYDIIAPILDRYDFKGWFYIPSFFMDVPVDEQWAYSVERKLDVTQPEMFPDKRIAMTWDEVRAIAARHEICCHTGNHFEITMKSSPEDMEREIVDSKRKLEEHLQMLPQQFLN